MNLLTTGLHEFILQPAGWLMKGLGKGMKEFKEGVAGDDEKKSSSGEKETEKNK